MNNGSSNNKVDLDVSLRALDEESRKLNMEEIENGELKVKINELLWCWLPPETTLEQAEELACEIDGKIYQMWLARKEGEK